MGGPPPYLASRTAARAGRPVEPWKDSLRLQMFIWGGLLLLAFVVPATIDPTTFQWDTIIDGAGREKIAPLIMAAAGLLSILLASIPTSPPPRGLVAGVFGLFGVVVPPIIALSRGNFDLGQILMLANLLGTVLLVPGLLIRNEYRESMLPRILVTIGALCVLALYLVPVNGKLLLVELFKSLIDAEGKQKVFAVILLIPLIYAVMSLLVWLPAPSTGLGTVVAWLWITAPLLLGLIALIVRGHIGDVVKHRPFEALLGPATSSAYLVLLGYGFATVFGKQLE